MIMDTDMLLFMFILYSVNVYESRVYSLKIQTGAGVWNVTMPVM